MRMKRMTILLVIALLALLLTTNVYAADIDGDFDNDGAVTDADFEILRAAFLTQLGDTDFDPALDLDGDGVISGVDFTLFFELKNG